MRSYSLACLIWTLGCLSNVADAYERRYRREQAMAGRSCQEAIECGQGAYCDNNKLCSCLSTHVLVNGFCWPKINPGQTGCSHDRQCAASWPGAACQSGQCRCANGQPAFTTKDGPVCLTYGLCPINGEVAKYKDDQGNPISCSSRADSECPPGHDCICGRPDCNEQALTFCCPGRGLTCIMPVDAGTFGGGSGMTLTRWYYNPMSGECESFAYRGQAGNANNFESKEHCESYCKQTCVRGMPQYESSSSPMTKQKQHYCSNEATCDPGMECTPIGTVQFCCPKTSFICSKTGGIVYQPGQTPTSNFDSGSAGGSVTTYARYYYDETEKKCMSFTYKGQGGNFNNFASLSECEQFCSKIVCDAGEPLKDSSGMRNLQCTGTECPETHYCNGGLCCPTKQTVCKLAKAVGFCSSTVRRWWFNAASGTCEEFMYSGCHGNANNFASYKECVDHCRDIRAEPKCSHGRALKDPNGNFAICGASGGETGMSKSCPINYHCHYDGKTYGCCPTQTYTCTLQSDPGNQCGPTVSRWYYDGTKRSCLTFDYLGCDGNSNNFATQQDCKEYCHVESCPEGGEIFTDESGAQRACRADADCPNTHYCTEINKWSGTAWRVLNYCCPNRNHICSLYTDSGSQCSGTSLIRWWFNSLTKACEEFTYNGCNGNRNNFATRQACMTYCMASACPAGTVAHQASDTDRLTSCNLYGSPECPSGYTCHHAPLMQQNICCGSPPALKEVCPRGSYPYLDPLALQPLQCTPNVDSSCPPGYFCSFRPEESTSSFYCCRTRSGSASNSASGGTSSAKEVETSAGETEHRRVCPPDLHPVPAGNHYRYCSPTASSADSSESCASRQSCQWSEALQRYICCAAEMDESSASSSSSSEQPGESSAICPSMPPNMMPERDRLTNKWRFCDPMTPDCSTGGVCLYSDRLDRYVCCSMTSEAPLPPSSIETVPEESVSETDWSAEPPRRTDTKSSDCGYTPNFTPIDPLKPCSPLVPGSCGSSSAQIRQCLFSVEKSQYICCGKS